MSPRARSANRGATAGLPAERAQTPVGDLLVRRAGRVVTNAPGSGVLRHADAGYDIAAQTAQDVGIRIPLQPGTHAPAWQA